MNEKKGEDRRKLNVESFPGINPGGRGGATSIGLYGSVTA